ncbi:MAG: hypothetical protein Q4G23_03020 [Clostridia bacterium]|nr:hypothetical protein [Clostridia bacterium]
MKNPYYGLKDKEREELYKRTSEVNKAGWTEANKAGDSVLAEEYHNREVENNRLYDKVSGTKSSYDPATGTWTKRNKTSGETIVDVAGDLQVAGGNNSGEVILDFAKTADWAAEGWIDKKPKTGMGDGLLEAGRTMDAPTAERPVIADTLISVGEEVTPVTKKTAIGDALTSAGKEMSTSVNAAMSPSQAVQPEVKKPSARERYENRKFEYDLDSDPLYQEYLARVARNGQRAMADTTARNAAMTGGMAGSYAVAAGADSYNEYMQNANAVIPELYALAYQKYQDELTRDLNLYEIEERERWETAERNAVLQKAQIYGVDALTQEEIELLYADGSHWIADGKVYGPEGELASENRYAKKEEAYLNSLIRRYENDGAKALGEDEKIYLETKGYVIRDGVLIRISDGMTYASKNNAYLSAYDNYDAYGWEKISDEDRQILVNQGYRYDPETDSIYKDGAYFPWRGKESLEDLEAKYKAGENLTPAEKLRMEKTGEYVFDNGVLYKNGELVLKTYMQNNEFQMAYNDYNTNGWYDMDPVNQIILQDYGYKFDDLTGMIIDQSGQPFRWGGSTPLDKAMATYLAGYELSEDDIMYLINKGYEFLDGTLYYEGTPIKRVYDGERNIPSDLSAAMSAVILSNQSGRALSGKYIDTLGKYGFMYDKNKGIWVHKDSGVPLLEYYK